MGPRGSGNFRGRASRGRGGRGGRGRGRGRGSSRFGPTRRFDGDRLADKDESENSESDEDEEDVPDSDSNEIDSEDDEDEKPAARPYMALLQSLNDSSGPTAKRRKLAHGESPAREAGRDDSEDGRNEAEDVDQVEEEVEEEEVDAEQIHDNNSDSDDENESTDPFDVHFAHADEPAVAKSVKAAKDGQWTTKRALIQTARATMMDAGTECKLEAPKPASSLSDFKLKQKLTRTAGKTMATLDDTQRTLMPLMFDYRDVLYCNRTVNNAEGLRQSACLHALNHIFKVVKNSYKLSKDGENTELEFRDQGFTRPKVLFLLPTRNSCARIVNVIRDLCEIDQHENRKRFDESYIEKEPNFGTNRPADFRELFEGNDDDMFRIGIKFTRKTIKYFAPFYGSDILLASPLGLRMAIGSEEDKKSIDYDFLSSIEMVIVDQADALLMQNWEHVEYIFEHLNLQPKEAHGCDFSRVRNWYLEDWAKYFRQTIILSGFNTPELSELQRLYCHNWAGKVRLQPEYAGVIHQLGIKAKQTFSRVQSESLEDEPDARFEYFVSAIVPTLVKRAKDPTGTLLFVPSYLDFVRVRNYFANSPTMSSITFGAISEYTDVPQASRARSHFLNGRHRVLLYTERAHHFRRYQLSGVQRVIFYGLPDNGLFYQEIAGGYLGKSEQDLVIEPGQGAVRALFSKYDVMKLERIAGSKRVGKMIQDRGDTFDFL
ncbi:hypothetical protein RJ55_03255 [Drechmeria coniospora]|nr:hypothetical protein RJ55_03255 [Drechmeria coniospora]